MKDNFSEQANLYARFRPSLPQELFEFLFSLAPNKLNAWDCACGNGQSAVVLSEFFKNVYATDISEKQLKNAVQKHNIHYSKQAAEKTDFETDFFDLIVISQAIHWFHFDEFYTEAKRVLKKDGIIAAIGYDLPRFTPEINTILDEFYSVTIGPFWDEERKWVEKHYSTLPFPFEEIYFPDFQIHDQWKAEHLIGYLNTWSAVQHFIKVKGFNPVEAFQKDLKKIWNENESIDMYFPVFSRVGKLN